MPELLGRTEPRLWTPPLRPLTPETSLGFEVIAFATTVLGVTLRPWQKWLLIHALELLDDGITYRFRKILVLVARQNGKTTLASVLAAWWLFVDSARHPDRIPPIDFKIVGVAQTLDIAREPWGAVKTWCDPILATAEEQALAIPDLQDATAAVFDTNGKENIIARSRAHYEIRVATNTRGKPAARMLMDELREQRQEAGWNAASQTQKALFNGMLIGFSNAGDSLSVVLKRNRDAALADVAAMEAWIADGLRSLEEYANTHDVSLGIFEWSAPDGCALDDVDGILQANPSIGYGAFTVQAAIAESRGMTEGAYRTEVLCQWVTSLVDSYIEPKTWRDRHVPIEDVRIPRGSRTVWSVDTSADRRTTWIAAAVETQAGLPFVTVRTKRPGMLWAVDYLAALAEESGQREVVLQGKGCPAMDFRAPLEKAGLIVHALDGGQVASSTGRIRDRIRDADIVLIEQPAVDLAVEGGVTVRFGDNDAWARQKSLPVDIAGLVAESLALYGLEVLEPAARKAPPLPLPAPASVSSSDGDDGPAEANLRTMHF